MAGARCPAVLVAAPASGQGKTTVACALARLHVRQGRRVRVFKCGPDFLDPHWLTLASAAPVHQLDLWMTGEADCRARLHLAAQEADLIIVEGVMGLFDGQPSAADLAQRFGLPVLAVVDASAMAGTFGALAFGLQHYQSGLRWAGVLGNRVAGARHADMLQAGLRESATWLGALPRNPTLVLPERHLGLTLASEVNDALQRLDTAADALASTPLGQMGLEELQRRWMVDFEQPSFSSEPGGACRDSNADADAEPNANADSDANANADTDAAGALNPHEAATPASTVRALQGCTIAVARDAAFCFIYAANLDCLRALGAELVFFSPLADVVLPVCDAVWLPGGYPELHAATLAANTGLRDSLRAHVALGRPVWAECGGMMVLFEQLTQTDGSRQALWGLLPGTVTMHKRLAALGPQQLELNGQVLRGHSFHYSTCDTPLPAQARTSRPGTASDGPVDARAGEALWVSGSVRASYFHAWFASDPLATTALFARANGVTEACA